MENSRRWGGDGLLEGWGIPLRCAFGRILEKGGKNSVLELLYK